MTIETPLVRVIPDGDRITWRTVAAVYWAIAWRSILIVFPLGFVGGIYGSLVFPGDPTRQNLVNTVVMVAVVPICALVLKRILTHGFDGYKIRVFGVSSTGQASDVGVPEFRSPFSRGQKIVIIVAMAMVSVCAWRSFVAEFDRVTQQRGIPAAFLINVASRTIESLTTPISIVLIAVLVSLFLHFRRKSG